jgi:hypothetical protein
MLPLSLSSSMSSSKALKSTSVTAGAASDASSRDLIPAVCERSAGKGRLRGRKCANGKDADGSPAANPTDATSRGAGMKKIKGEGAGVKKSDAKESDVEEAGDAAKAELSDGVDEPVQAGSKRVEAATGTGKPTPPPPAPVVDNAKTPVHQKNGTSVLGMLKRQDPNGESPRVTAAASSSTPAASAAAFTAGEASSARDVYSYLFDASWENA